MEKNGISLAKHTLYYLIVTFILLEGLLWILGWRPYRNTNYSVTSDPPKAFTGHPYLGIKPSEGAFNITINDSLTFQSTHLENGLRMVTGNPDKSVVDVLMLGCSYTYGYGVNDDEHFTSLLQRMHPNLAFQNAGVIGYGTTQSLLQLKEAVKKDSIKMVVLNFSSFHFMRNTLSRKYRSHLKIGYNRSSDQVQEQMAEAQFPFLSACGDSIQYECWNEIYDNWKGREWLASVNAFQSIYDNLVDDEANQIGVTACMMKEMAQICKTNGIKFQIACLNSSPASEKLKEQVNERNWIDVGFSFQDTSLTNYPIDDHPSPHGHQFIADQMEEKLGSLFNSLAIN